MAPEMFTIPVGFTLITKAFEAFCQHNGLNILAAAVEKHGSWE